MEKESTTEFWMKKIEEEIRNRTKAELISFIKNRAWEVKNNIHDSINFKNGYYLATEEIMEKLNETLTKPKT